MSRKEAGSQQDQFIRKTVPSVSEGTCRGLVLDTSKEISPAPENENLRSQPWR